MLCCKHPKSVYGESQTYSPYWNKTCNEVLKGTLDYGLRYAYSGEIRLHGFTNLDWARSAKDRKNTARCCFSI